jgi:hypothetical protein
MKRALKPGQNHYRKIGGADIEINGRIVKSGETAILKDNHIPDAFKDMFIRVFEDEIEEEETKVESKYEIRPSKEDEDYWDVINTETEETMNNTSLLKEAAQYLKEQLDAEVPES